MQERWQAAQDVAMAEAIKAAAAVKHSKSDSAKDLRERVKLLEVRAFVGSICSICFPVYLLLSDRSCNSCAVKSHITQPHASLCSDLMPVRTVCAHTCCAKMTYKHGQNRFGYVFRSMQKSTQMLAHSYIVWCGMMAVRTAPPWTLLTYWGKTLEKANLPILPR